MANTPKPPPDDVHGRRTPLNDDLGPEGMDPEPEGNLDTTGADDTEAYELDGIRNDQADGTSDRRQSPGQGRTSGTHGAAQADIDH